MMHRLDITTGVLAQATDSGGELPMPLRALRDQWGESHIPMGWVIFAASALLVSLTALWLWSWWRGRHERPQPWWTFFQAARHMGLTWREQWLLICIARHEGLASPLTLMLSPRTLRHHGRAYVQRRLPHRRLAAMRRLAAIRSALFDTPSPGGTTAEGV